MIPTPQIPARLAGVFAAIVMFSNANAANSPDRSDWEFKNACGPISLWTACRLQGVDVSLREIGAKCGFRHGEPCSIRSIHRALADSWLLKAEAGRLSPNELRQALSRGDSVVLFVRKGMAKEIDHSVCVVDLREVDKEKAYIVVDYPDVERRISTTELLNIWDGHAILVRRSLIGRCAGISYHVLLASILLLITSIVIWQKYRTRGLYVEQVARLVD